MRNAPLVAADLSCSGCGRPLVKDGKLKCTKCPCKCEVEATLGQKVICCPHCKGPHGEPRKLAVNDRALCPDRNCPNHKNRIGTQMQSTLSREETVPTKRSPSKTKFWQDRLHDLDNLAKEQQDPHRKEGINALVQRARALNFDPDLIEKTLGCEANLRIESIGVHGLPMAKPLQERSLPRDCSLIDLKRAIHFTCELPVRFGGKVKIEIRPLYGGKRLELSVFPEESERVSAILYIHDDLAEDGLVYYYTGGNLWIAATEQKIEMPLKNLGTVTITPGRLEWAPIRKSNDAYVSFQVPLGRVSP